MSCGSFCLTRMHTTSSYFHLIKWRSKIMWVIQFYSCRFWCLLLNLSLSKFMVILLSLVSIFLGAFTLQNQRGWNAILYVVFLPNPHGIFICLWFNCDRSLLESLICMLKHSCCASGYIWLNEYRQLLSCNCMPRFNNYLNSSWPDGCYIHSIIMSLILGLNAIIWSGWLTY